MASRIFWSVSKMFSEFVSQTNSSGRSRENLTQPSTCPTCFSRSGRSALIQRRQASTTSRSLVTSRSSRDRRRQTASTPSWWKARERTTCVKLPAISCHWNNIDNGNPAIQYSPVLYDINNGAQFTARHVPDTGGNFSSVATGL